MAIADWFKRVTGRQHANRTVHHRTSIFDRPRIPTGVARKVHTHARENARRRRQIEHGVLKVG